MQTDSYSDIGAILRYARVEMQLSLQQASQALHIRAHYLDALEYGRLNELPGAAYTKGYLLAYAGFLRLDRDEIVRRFERVEQTLPQRGFFLPEVFSKEKSATPSLVWGALAAALAFYGIWLVLFQPPSVNVSSIEPPPERVEPLVPITTVPMQDVACIAAENQLYPACYSAYAPGVVSSRYLPLARDPQHVFLFARH
jgi:cytoskeleton protein RodZ